MFCQVLDRYGIRDSEAAYFLEDETDYSAHDFDKQEHKCNPPRYVFPRDISHLRNVYQQEAPAGGEERSQAAVPGVNFSIKDPNVGEDSVPTFSNAQTPLSQDSVVHLIMEDFRRRRVRLVYIVATNLLDSLFLTQVAREASPDTRVLTESPDVLFVAAASQTPLGGTLFLSTYPMFLEGDRWLNANSNAHQILFPNPDFEGLFNATQAVLAEIGVIQVNEAAESRRGYAQISPDRSHPGLWLLTLDRSGFSPIDLIDEGHPKTAGGIYANAHEKWFALAGDAQKDRDAELRRAIEFGVIPRSWFVTALVISGLAWWSSWLTVQANSAGGGPCWPLWLCLGYVRQPDRRQRDINSAASRQPELPAQPETNLKVKLAGAILAIPRLVTLIGALLAVSIMETILFLPFWFSSFEAATAFRELLRQVFGLVGLVGCLAPLGVAIWLWRKAPPRAFRYEAWFYLGLEAAVYVVVGAAWIWCCLLAGSPGTLLFRFRAIELYSGSSPALPLLLLGMVTLMGSVFYLKRFSRAGFGRPCLELSAFQSLGGSLRRSYRAINSRIAGPAEARLSYCFLRGRSRTSKTFFRPEMKPKSRTGIEGNKCGNRCDSRFNVARFRYYFCCSSSCFCGRGFMRRPSSAHCTTTRCPFLSQYYCSVSQ